MASFFDIELDGVPLPVAECDMPTKKGTVIIVTLRTILSWVIGGGFQSYIHNRGTGRVSKRTADSCRSGAHEDSIGMLTLGEREGEICSTDWHSRLYGFLQRYIAGEMSAAELKIKVPVRVVRDFLHSYTETNAAEAHRTSDKIQCPDLLFGAMWQEITKPLSPDCIKMVTGKKWTVISSVLYSIQHIGRDNAEWTWWNVYQNRGPAMKLANNHAGDGLHVSKANLAAVGEAVQYWYELVLALKAGAGPTNVTPIVSSAGFFGFIVVNRLSPQNLMPVHNTTVVAKILSHINDMLNWCPELCRGHKSTIITFAGNLMETLKLKPHVPKAA